MSPCPLGETRCDYQAGVRRHKHPADLLNLIGQCCSCGANDWHVTFGGLIPARIVCGQCLEGFNIADRLRTCGQQDGPVYRKAGYRR